MVKNTKKNASYKCLSLIMLDSVVEVKKNIILKHFCKNVNIKQKRLKWRPLLMINYNQVHLVINLIMNLKSHLRNLTMGQTMRLTMNLAVNKLLKVKSVF